MNMKKAIAIALPIIVTALLLTSCASSNKPMGPGGTAWGVGAFGSNGERIYFTATSERGTGITYTGGPASNGWMMGGGNSISKLEV